MITVDRQTLKWLAAATMLIDHIGAILLPHVIVLRFIGRIAFPIYCFLLSEGARHTRSPLRYALRLLVGVVISERAFDMAIFGAVNPNRSSVMLTLLLGFCALWAGRRLPTVLRVVVALPFAVLARTYGTDYGAMGVWLIVLFAMTQHSPRALLWQTVGMAVLFRGSSIELFALLALIPIHLYDGTARAQRSWAQWGWYLFYPAHLWVLYLLK